VTVIAGSAEKGRLGLPRHGHTTLSKRRELFGPSPPIAATGLDGSRDFAWPPKRFHACLVAEKRPRTELVLV
jgi:hypothetical protein